MGEITRFKEVLAILRFEGGVFVDEGLYFDRRIDYKWWKKEQAHKDLDFTKDYSAQIMLLPFDPDPKSDNYINVIRMPDDIIIDAPKKQIELPIDDLPDEELLPQFRGKKPIGRKSSGPIKLNLKR